MQRKTKVKYKFGLVLLEQIEIEKQLDDIRPDIVVKSKRRSIVIEMVYSLSVKIRLYDNV